MRILGLRFANLNSLVGEWQIDFTAPAYVADGLFAITGPTGAGKTTLLDAICLALYGRTPRLDRINKSGNEIMARQTGRCFAEVTFATDAGRYTVHWSQWRSRDKPDGELQMPRHEISDAVKGTVLEAKIRDVAQRVESVTGMDFARFTRAMLLAQGDFAAFLQASPDERAPLLEQITGTELYSDISIRVHELRASALHQLALLEQRIEIDRLLTPEQHAAVRQEMESLRQESTRLAAALASRLEAVNWLTAIDQQQQEIVRLRATEADWQARDLAFAADRARLLRSQRALELSADHAEVVAVRQQQLADKEVHQAKVAALPALLEARDDRERVLGIVTRELEEARAALAAAAPLLRGVRDLDQDIMGRTTRLAEQQALLERQHAHVNAVQAEQQGDTTLLQQMQSRHDAVSSELAGTAEDADLLDTLPVVIERVGQLESRAEHIRRLQADLDAAVMRQQTLERDGAAEQEKLTLARSTLLARQAALDEARRQQHAVLDGRAAADWRSDQGALQSEREECRELIAVLGTRNEAARELERLGSLAQERASQLQATETGLAAARRHATALMALVESRERNLVLARQLESLEQARARLNDGEPCPLCGATDHPYRTAGELPVVDAASDALDAARKELRLAEAQVGGLDLQRSDLARAAGQHAEVEAQWQQRHTQAVLTLEMRLAAVADATVTGSMNEAMTQTGAGSPALAALLDNRLAAVSKRLAAIDAVLTRIDALASEQARRQADVDMARQALDQASAAAQEAAQQATTAAQGTEHLRQSLAAARAEQSGLETALRAQFAGFGVTLAAPTPVAGFVAACGTLQLRRDRWQALTQERDTLAQDLGKIAARIETRAIRLTELARERARLQVDLEQRRVELAACHERRRALFGEREVDAEERALATRTEIAERQLTGARETHQARVLEQVTLENQIESLARSILDRTQRLVPLEAALLARLAALDFADETDYLAARLSAAERRNLENLDTVLRNAGTDLAARLGDARARLTALWAQALTEQPIHELRDEVTRLGEQQANTLGRIGSFEQRLEDDARLQAEHRLLLADISQQKREVERWQALHDLIGSADGKKFRNFAQGLTFQLMIAHANRQLHKMSDRYLLVRTDDQPLALSVVDNYQAGEVRPTRNLSGGESFIVSLALALGLSRMASRAIRVDSLFLDEGFGTLDEDTLETALETLAGLQQDGKLIGVISHVEALKERIGTRISVLPEAGGRSRLEGPGCQRVPAG